MRIEYKDIIDNSVVDSDDYSFNYILSNTDTQKQLDNTIYLIENFCDILLQKNILSKEDIKKLLFPNNNSEYISNFKINGE